MQQETVGFWRGLGMAWTALVMAIVKVCQMGEEGADAGLTVAKSLNGATKVLEANVRTWADQDEALKKLSAPTPTA